MLEGARLARISTRRADLRHPFSRDFSSRLEGQHILTLRRRAKYLLADLTSGDVLVMHLGMSGSFRVVDDALAPLSTHDHVVLELSSGARVVFNDPRRFGSMRVVAGPHLDGDPALSGLGPEPLDEQFTAQTLARAVHRRTISLKAALLDQRVAAGLGNIYACEALHRARLSPRRRASTLATRGGRPTPATAGLVHAIKAVLEDAIAHSHQVGGPDRFRVYDREGRRCPRRTCRGVIARIVQAGRSTFFCPDCQR